MDFDPQLFLGAQTSTWKATTTELFNEKKETHWMWWVFPMIKGLAPSERSVKYSIQSELHANLYLQDAVLEDRLKECCLWLLLTKENDIHKIMGSPDDLKLQSSMTLFSHVSTEDSIYEDVLNKFYNGERCQRTLNTLAN